MATLLGQIKMVILYLKWFSYYKQKVARYSIITKDVTRFEKDWNILLRTPKPVKTTKTFHWNILNVSLPHPICPTNKLASNTGTEKYRQENPYKTFLWPVHKFHLSNAFLPSLRFIEFLSGPGKSRGWKVNKLWIPFLQPNRNISKRFRLTQPSWVTYETSHDDRKSRRSWLVSQSAEN